MWSGPTGRNHQLTDAAAHCFAMQSLFRVFEDDGDEVRALTYAEGTMLAGVGLVLSFGMPDHLLTWSALIVASGVVAGVARAAFHRIRRTRPASQAANSGSDKGR